MSAPDIRITILVDNTAVAPSLLTEHGLSVWIDVGDRHILWDTGQSDRLVHNARAMGIDLGRADAVALSHGHYDHTGGLAAVLGTAPNAKVYLHPNAVEARYSLKKDGRRFIGMPQNGRRRLTEKKAVDAVVYVNQRTEIFGGMTLTGPVPRRTAYEDTGGHFYNDPACTVVDDIADDQSLYFECSEGLVIVLGCAHSGVVNILDAVSEWTASDKIYAVIGGMHLVNADADRMERTIKAFQRYSIQKIAPLHCTGIRAMQQLKEVFGSRCLALGTGSQICFS